MAMFPMFLPEMELNRTFMFLEQTNRFLNTKEKLLPFIIA